MLVDAYPVIISVYRSRGGGDWWPRWISLSRGKREHSTAHISYHDHYHYHHVESSVEAARSAVIIPARYRCISPHRHRHHPRHRELTGVSRCRCFGASFLVRFDVDVVLDDDPSFLRSTTMLQLMQRPPIVTNVFGEPPFLLKLNIIWSSDESEAIDDEKDDGSPSNNVSKLVHQATTCRSIKQHRQSQQLVAHLIQQTCRSIKQHRQFATATAASQW